MEKLLLTFRDASEQDYIQFDSLTSKQRQTIHAFCELNGLYSKSSGEGEKRIITVYRNKPEYVVAEITEEHRKHFIKAFGLPIPVTKKQYFEYYLELFDDLYDTKQKYDLLVQAVNTLANRNKQLHDYALELCNIIASEIKNTDSYQELVANNILFSTTTNLKDLPGQTHIYKVPTSKMYISLDIIKANFNCLKWKDNALVLGCDTWEDLVKKFTDIEYFIQAKYFRQFVFGNLNHKKIESIQKYLQKILYNMIKDHVTVQGCLGSDEIIISTTNETINTDIKCITKIISQMPEQMKNIWRITAFTLEPLGKSSSYVKKDFITGKFEIKNIEKDFYAQAYKFYKKEPVNQNDLKAMKDNYVITYEEYYDF